jgi:pSer/pThr/pTyr-binding forkhead associated (FHA) protein
MIRCPNCKNEEFEGAMFCSQCGATLLGVEQAEPKESCQSYIIQVTFTDTDKVVTLKGKEKYVLGRIVPSADEVLIDLDMEDHNGYEKGVSRQHAMIKFTEEGFKVVDLNSSNRTFLDEEELYPGNEYVLKENCMLRLGKLRMNIRIQKV